MNGLTCRFLVTMAAAPFAASPASAQQAGPHLPQLAAFQSVGQPSQGTGRAIRALMTKLDGWAGDEGLPAGAYAADAELVTPEGRVVRGGESIEAMMPEVAESWSIVHHTLALTEE